VIKLGNMGRAESKANASDIPPSFASSVPADDEAVTLVRAPDEELLARASRPVLRAPPIPREEPEEEGPEDPVLEIVVVEQEEGEFGVPRLYELEEDEQTVSVTGERLKKVR
jgi:hypothetical protein